MATARIRYDPIKSSLGLRKEELEDLLFELGIEPEGWEGNFLEVEITPDRPDLFTTYGILRMLREYLKGERKEIILKESNYEIIVDESVRSVRPYIAGLVCKGLSLSDEDIWEMIQLQEKIHSTFGRKRKKAAIGFHDLDKIKFPLYYRAEEPEKIRFVPLGFQEEMNGREILQKHPKGMEYSHLLKGYDRFPVLRDSKGDVLSMPPIINSEKIGKITEETENVFVDITGNHLWTVEKISNIIAMTLSEMGGEIYKVKVLYKEGVRETPRDDSERFSLDPERCSKMIGLKLSREEISELLERMGHKVLEVGEKIVVRPPFYRVDIMDEVDLIDDVARAYGFNRMEPRVPKVFTIGRLDSRTKVERILSKLLIGLGFQEVFTFSLLKREEQTSLMRIEDIDLVELGKVKVPFDTVRRWLLPSLLKTISFNKNAEKPIKVFEISYVVIPDDSFENKARNELHLSLAICDSSVNFTQIREVLDYIFDRLGKKVIFKEYSHPSFIEGRCAEIMYHGERVGFAGEIHPEVLLNFKIDFPIVAAEVDLERLFHFKDS